MHTILFDNYRKYQMETRNSVFKAFWKLPIPAILIFFTIVLTVIYAVLSIFIECLQQWYVLCLIFEAIACVALYFYTENYQINSSPTRLKVYKRYCGEINSWLKTTGLIINEENLKDIISRVNLEIETLEEKRCEHRNRIEKWIQILIIPILLAIFSEVIREKTDISVLIAYALVLLVSFGSLALAFLSCYNIIDFFQKRRLEQFKSFSDDLQGVIDTQLSKKLYKADRKKFKVVINKNNRVMVLKK